MLKGLLGALFRFTPITFRRWFSRFTNARFSATAGAVVVNEEGRLLLLKHVFRAGSGWGIPGGFIKPGEQPEEAVRRELREEVGLELAQVEFAFIRTLKRTRQIEVVFFCRSHGEARLQSVEVERADWFSLNALPETLSADQRWLIERALSGKRVSH